jgi:hypothetical protein
MPILGALGALRDGRIPRESWRKADIRGLISARSHNWQNSKTLAAIGALLFALSCAFPVGVEEA